MSRTSAGSNPPNQEESSQTLSPQAEQILMEFGEYLYQISGLDVATARSYLRSVTELAGWREAASKKTFQPEKITRSVLRQYIDYLHQVRKLKYATVQGRIAGLRSYFGWLSDNGVMDAGDDPTRGLKVAIAPKRKAVYDQRITIRVTTPMWNHLRTLAGSEREIPSVVREATRDYLDQQADLAGSKRWQGEKLQEEVDRLGWYLTFIVILIAQIGSLILTRLADGEDQQQFRPAVLLDKAHDSSLKSGLSVRAGMDDLAESSKQQRMRQQIKKSRQKSSG